MINEQRIWSEARYRNNHDPEFVARVRVAVDMILKDLDNLDNPGDELYRIVYETAMIAMQVAALPIEVLNADPDERYEELSKVFAQAMASYLERYGIDRDLARKLNGLS